MAFATALQGQALSDLPDIEVEALVERFQEGDDRAFDEIVELYQPQIARLAMRLLGWPQETRDVVQDVLISIFENLPRFRRECRLWTWIARITTNCCRRYQRKAMLQRRLLRFLWNRRAEEDHQPDEVADFHWVRAAVRRLPGKYREAVVLRYFEQLSPSEIAEVLNVSTNCIAARLSRARKRLKELLSASKETFF